jgi:uncharacterized protein (TIGR02646 family)
VRHIPKNQSNPTARARLESINYRTDIDNSINARKGSFYRSKKYGHQIVRNELNDIYFSKCAFCESKIRPVATPNVEHFRPKSEISGVNENGYYWLGYEWSNLLLACPSCNGAKGTKFPLYGHNHITTHPVNIHGNIDYSRFPENQGYLAKERPLLINPEYWHPEKLMYIDYFGRLIPIKNNIFATTTIKEIELNRDDLVAKRQKKIDKIIVRLEEQIFARYCDNPLNDLQYQYQLNIIFKDIVGRLDKKAEYTLLGKCMVERFDELILDDIEPEFREEIMNYFIEFLNNP